MRKKNSYILEKFFLHLSFVQICGSWCSKIYNQSGITLFFYLYFEIPTNVTKIVL